MKLETKWKVRQFALQILTTALSATAFVTVYLAIQFQKFLDFGLDMYPAVKLAKPTVSNIFHVFRDLTFEPVMFKWLPIALAVDFFIIRPIQRRLIK